MSGAGKYSKADWTVILEQAEKDIAASGESLKAWAEPRGYSYNAIASARARQRAANGTAKKYNTKRPYTKRTAAPVNGSNGFVKFAPVGAHASKVEVVCGGITVSVDANDDQAILRVLKLAQQLKQEGI